MSEQLEFQVQGSAAEPYTVTFVRPSPGYLHAYCTCPAGANGQHCKHRTQILEGDDDAIASVNRADASLIRGWLSGTEIERHLLAFRQAEAEVERAKKALTAAQKLLARAMRG